jgi:uncharacterized protein DUF6772
LRRRNSAAVDLPDSQKAEVHVGLDQASITEAVRKGMIQANPALSRFNPLPRILFLDDFDDGLCGWTEQVGNYRDTLDVGGGVYSSLQMDLRPPMLSTATMWDSGTVGSLNGGYSMKLATRPRANHIAKLNKRITIGGSGLLQFEMWFVVKPEATRMELSKGTEEFYQERRSLGVPWEASRPETTDLTVHAFGVSMDLQDRERRWWPAVRFLNCENGELVEKWQWGAGGVRHPYLDGWLDIEDGHQPLCYNEIPTKHNWHYFRFTVDLQSREYVELQCNDREYDLRGKRYEYRNIHPHEKEFLPYMDPENPTIPRCSGMLNSGPFVETGDDRRTFLYVDSVLLSADW